MPISPRRAAAASAVTAGWKRTVCPTTSVVPRPSVAATMASSSGSDSAAGFSTWTCLPASPAAIVSRACVGVAVTTSTACTASSARASSRDVVARAPGTSAASARVRFEVVPDDPAHVRAVERRERGEVLAGERPDPHDGDPDGGGSTLARPGRC